MSDIKVKIKGVSYTGWSAIEVSQSLDQMCGTFGFTVSDRHTSNPGEWDIKIGDYCEVEVNSKIIASGYLEEPVIQYDATSHSVQFSGRDITAELVDCSYVDDTGNNRNEWKGQTLRRLVSTLCDPFGISVDVDLSILTEAETVISEMTTNEGDGVAELIKKVCDHKALLPISYGDGRLTLTRAGSKKATDSLELGKNIKACNFTCSDRERYNKYIAKGSSAEDEFKGLVSITSAFGEYIDGGIRRYRPLVILVDGDSTKDKCQNIAKFQASRRAGASRSVQYTIQGWTQSDGTPWSLNSMVRVKDHYCRINDTRLISALHFTKNSTGGETTNITLSQKEAYEIQEKPIKIVESFWDKKESD